MTPNAIEILIHCYCCSEPHPRADAPAVEEELRSLEQNGMITPNDRGGYTTTERGYAHVVQLCQIPWPTAGWIDANGNPIKPHP